MVLPEKRESPEDIINIGRDEEESVKCVKRGKKEEEFFDEKVESRLQEVKERSEEENNIINCRVKLPEFRESMRELEEEKGCGEDWGECKRERTAGNIHQKILDEINATQRMSSVSHPYFPQCMSYNPLAYQYSQYSQYPQYPQYGHLPHIPQYPQYPQYEQHPYIPQYPQYPQYPHPHIPQYPYLPNSSPPNYPLQYISYITKNSRPHHQNKSSQK